MCAFAKDYHGLLVKEVKKVSDNKQYANAIYPQLGISNRNKVALQVLSYYYRPHESAPSPEEIQFIQEFLKDIEGDMEFNDKLGKIPLKSFDAVNISKYTSDEMKYFTYKTRHYKNKEEEFSLTFDRLSRNFDNRNNNMEPTGEDKISLSEYGLIYDIGRLNKTMSKLADLKFLEGDVHLTKLTEQTKQALQMVNSIEQDFQTQLKSKDEPGKIVLKKMLLDDEETKSSAKWSLTKWCEAFFTKLSFFLTKHGHAAKLYNKQVSDPIAPIAPTLSHINPSAILEKFSMLNYLYTDVYKIKIDALIPEEQKVKLKLAFGEDKWQEKVNNLYAQIEREIHDNTVSNFSKLATMTLPGLIWRGLSCFLGHKQFRENDFDEIHRLVKDTFYQKDTHHMLCSEFVAHTIIAALVELDKRLKQELQQKGIEPPKGAIVTIPFGKHEDLAKMHPDRLLTVLQEHGCIEREATVPIVTRLFSEENHTLTK